MKNKMICSQGFSIIEALIGAAILSIVGLSVVYLTSTDRGGMSSSFSSKSESCRTTAHAVLSQISSNGNLNFLTYINEVGETRPAYSENFLDAQKRWGSQLAVSEPGLNPNIRISQYSVGALSGLSALARSADYCTNFRAVPDEILKKNNIDVGRDQIISMRIVPFQKSNPSRIMSCDKALVITPRSKDPSKAIGNQIAKVTISDDVGLSVYVKVTSRIASGGVAGEIIKTSADKSKDAECTAKQDFVFDSIDPLSPMRVFNQFQDNEDAISCSATSELADLQGATFNKSGQASVFMCRDRTVSPLVKNKSSDSVYVCKSMYGCRALKPEFLPVVMKTIPGPDWFDCKYLKDAAVAPKLHGCLDFGGQVNVTFSKASPLGTMVIGLSKMQRGCHAIIDVTEIDAGAQVSDDNGAIKNVARFLQFKNFGKKPGNRSCECQNNKKFWVCDNPANPSPQACPQMKGAAPAIPSAEGYTPGVISACDCFPNSCNCSTFYSANQSLCNPPPPPGGEPGGETKECECGMFNGKCKRCGPTTCTTPGGCDGTCPCGLNKYGFCAACPTDPGGPGPGGPGGPPPPPIDDSCGSCQESARAGQAACAASCTESEETCRNNCFEAYRGTCNPVCYGAGT